MKAIRQMVTKFVKMATIVLSGLDPMDPSQFMKPNNAHHV